MTATIVSVETSSLYWVDVDPPVPIPGRDYSLVGLRVTINSPPGGRWDVIPTVQEPDGRNHGLATRDSDELRAAAYAAVREAFATTITGPVSDTDLPVSDTRSRP